MDDLPVVLHVGAPKAGSSALQHDLTWNPHRPLVGRPGLSAEYLAIDAVGTILRGDALEAFASQFAARYCMSADLADLMALRSAPRRALARELAAMRAGGTIPILSYELWLHSPLAAVHRFTAALAAPLHVVVYVRDPVSWLRSLLWQRRGPLEGSRRQWVEEQMGGACWADPVAVWRSAPGVVRLDVRLADRSVPRDFAGVVGFEPPATDILHNVGIPAEFARFIERHAIPPDLHVSEAKFAWSRWTSAAGIADGFAPTPTSFDADDIRAIVERTAASSAALLRHCDDDVRSRIVADARWWSADPEVHAGRAPCAPPSTPVQEADRLLEATLRALVAADVAWRREERLRRLAERTIGDLGSRLAAAEATLHAASVGSGDAGQAPDESVRPAGGEGSCPDAGHPRRGAVARLRGIWRRIAA